MGVVLAAAYSDEAAAAVTDLPLLGGSGAAGPTGPAVRRPAAAAPAAARAGQSPGPGLGADPERFRDPSSGAIMRVWLNPTDRSRHYVPDSAS